MRKVITMSLRLGYPDIDGRFMGLLFPVPMMTEYFRLLRPRI